MLSTQTPAAVVIVLLALGYNAQASPILLEASGVHAQHTKWEAVIHAADLCRLPATLVATSTQVTVLRGPTPHITAEIAIGQTETVPLAGGVVLGKTLLLLRANVSREHDDLFAYHFSSDCDAIDASSSARVARSADTAEWAGITSLTGVHSGVASLLGGGDSDTAALSFVSIASYFSSVIMCS